MKDKIDYVNRKYKRVVVPLTFAAIASICYILFALAATVLSNYIYIKGDLFKFCILVIISYVPFYLMLRLTRFVIISSLSRRL